MRPALRKGDIHICFQFEGQKPHIGGEVLDGDESVLVEGRPIAVEGGRCDCRGSSSPSKPKLSSGHPKILINGKPAAGMATDHNGLVMPSTTSLFLG